MQVPRSQRESLKSFWIFYENFVPFYAAVFHKSLKSRQCVQNPAESRSGERIFFARDSLQESIGGTASAEGASEKILTILLCFYEEFALFHAASDPRALKYDPKSRMK